MRASIQPVSAVPANLLFEHLRQYGLPAEIINWKYFDPGFRHSGERGWVWLKEDKVKGLIGLLPFTLASTAGRAACAWTCDWFVADAARNPGIGALLLKEAIEQEGLLVTLGGNEATARMVPRMAAHAVDAAAVGLTLPLRLGGLQAYRALAARAPGAFGSLSKMPLRPRGGRPNVGVRTEAGIAPPLAEVLESATRGAAWSPVYDFDYVRWQLERCPVLESFTVYVDARSAPAAAVVWRPKRGAHWRMAFWAIDTGAEHCGAVIDEAVNRVYALGAESLSALAGRGDTVSLGCLRAAGFRENALSLPLYVLARDRNTPIERVSGLGYADSDLGYRF